MVTPLPRLLGQKKQQDFSCQADFMKNRGEGRRKERRVMICARRMTQLFYQENPGIAIKQSFSSGLIHLRILDKNDSQPQLFYTDTFSTRIKTQS
jgi:hypothetical protein